MTRRENARQRRSPVRRSRPLVLVVCGARCTELQYLGGLRDRVRSRALDIVLARHAKAPLQVVEYAAASAARSGRDFDEVWCVVDVDDFDIKDAVQVAMRADIELAVSNPCFELWLLLHLEDCRAPLANCVEAHRRIKKRMPRFDKTRLDLGPFVDGVELAVRRGRALDETGSCFERNPSTSVWRLVERMTEQ